GFPGSARMREKLIQVETLAQLEDVVSEGDASAPFPAGAIRLPRGKKGGRRRVVLPDGYLDDLQDPTPPTEDAAALEAVSGG
ncbi:MAG: tRNA dihydrouridine synthase DusB, partial [Myxococcota bacterium]